MDIERLLDYAQESRASDMHLNANSYPVMRVDGALKILNTEEMLTDQILQELFDSITNEKQKETLHERRQLDFAYVIPEVGRFRVNALIQRNALSFAL